MVPPTIRSLAWPAFFLRLLGGVLLVASGIRGIFEPDFFEARDLLHMVEVVGGAMLIGGLRRRLVSIALGFVVIASTAIAAFGRPAAVDVVGVLVRLTFLLPGLTLASDVDSISADAWLKRRRR
jgi:hypothetical protein